MESPFYEMTKGELIRWYLKQGLSKEELFATWTCYRGGQTPCARCGACFRRWIAFSLNGLEEPWYEKISKWEGVCAYKEKMKRGEYESERTKETLEVFRKWGVIKG